MAALADGLGISRHIALGDGELKSGGARRPSILSDAVEAVLGAVLLDGGFDAVSKVVDGICGASLAAVDPATTGKDAKTLLQELLQRRHYALPHYEVIIIRGESHAQEFEVECVIEQMNIRCTGTGSSRRRAEQEAARKAYDCALAR